MLLQYNKAFLSRIVISSKNLRQECNRNTANNWGKRSHLYLPTNNIILHNNYYILIFLRQSLEKSNDFKKPLASFETLAPILHPIWLFCSIMSKQSWRVCIAKPESSQFMKLSSFRAPDRIRLEILRIQGKKCRIVKKIDKLNNEIADRIHYYPIVSWHP